MNTASYRLPVFTTIFIALYVVSIGSVLAAPEKEDTTNKDLVDKAYKQFQDCLMGGNMSESDAGLKCSNSEGSVTIPNPGRTPPYDPSLDPIELKSGSSMTLQMPATSVLAPTTLPPTTPTFPPNPTPEKPPILTKPLVAPAKETFNSPAVRPNNQNIKILDSRVQSKVPSRFGVGQGVGNNNKIEAVPLTRGECEQVGGIFRPADLCDEGNMCQVTDQYGKVHSVCLSTMEILIDTDVQKEPKKPSSTIGIGKVTIPSGSVVAKPLSSAQCKGLGGSVISTTKCDREGQQACATVDPNGIVRTACINAKDQ